MYAFIILQENIFASKEYKHFISNTLGDIQRLSDIKATAMAYLYNNNKIKTTINNQFEKDKMIKKLAQVNRQLKKWNQTVFNKSEEKTLEEKQKKKELRKIKKEIKKEKKKQLEIKEAPEKEEEDQEKSAFDDAPPVMKTVENKKNKAPGTVALTKQESNSTVADEPIRSLKEYEGLDKNNLSKKLVSEKLGMLWQIYVLGVRW
jgi:hypothetical protein